MLNKILPFLCTLLALGFNTRATSPSPNASVDLICHTNHASECYPRTFRPTEYFQLVHDDQDLPPSLHVRLNLATGKKEAKINVADEDDEALMATTLDVAVIDSPSSDLETQQSQAQAQQVMKLTEQGSIRPPTQNSLDGASFEASKADFKAAPSNTPKIALTALETLEELSHDIYWGLKLAQDSDIVLKLVSVLSFNGSDPHVKGAAALLFGTAIQNNPAAFAAALSHFYNDEAPTGPMEAVLIALVHEQLPQLLTRFVYLLSELCQDRAHLLKFLNEDGLEILMTVFDAPSAGKDGKDRLRGKIANFILDHFLQKDSLGMSKESNRKKSQSSDAEVESNLEDEDSWVLSPLVKSTDLDNVYNWPHKTDYESQGRSHNLACKLKPWCSAFSKSLRVWKGNKKGSDPVGAVENVEQAHQALQKKLKSFECSCETSCIHTEQCLQSGKA